MRIINIHFALALGLMATVDFAVGTATPVFAAEPLEETPQNDIAAQIRRQGYTCDKPESATRDREHSKPNAAVWILKCENRSYRVRLTPDMGAAVEAID
jgi:hypothetical protein